MDRSTQTGKMFADMAAAMYDDRCVIRRRNSTKSPDGGNLVTESIVASDVPCRLSASSADEKLTAGAPEGRTAYTVRMPMYHNEILIKLDSECFLDIAAHEGGVEAQSLAVVAPLPGGSGAKIDAVAIRQS